MDVMITRRGGGVGLNFKIVGGTTQPSSPKENTIWVSTDMEITEWSLSTDKPSAPVEGMVWIRTDPDGLFSFNALQENELNVRIVYAMQYTGSWDVKQSSVYQNEKWTALSVYLYNRGDLCEDVTGGWTNPNVPPSGERVYPVFNSDHMKMYATYGVATHATTAKSINTVLFDRIEAVVEVKSTYSGYSAIRLRALNESGTEISSVNSGENFTGKKTLTLPLDGVDSCYPSFYVGGLEEYKVLVYEAIMIPRGEDA